MYGPKTPNPGHSHSHHTSHVSGMEMYERDRMEVERRNQMMLEYYRILDDTGYEETPVEMYENRM